MNSCITCHKIIINRDVICKKCQKDPFRIEDLRNFLAKNNDLEGLKDTYLKDFPEIKDKNTNPFWNKKFKIINDFNHQDGMTQDRIRQVNRFIPRKKIKLLDIGAGTGFIEELLRKRLDIDLYANDISNVSIEYLKNNFEGKFKQESLYNMNYQKNFFDVILLLEVLEHVSPKKTFKLLVNIKQLLKPNGLLIISIPINEGLENMSENLNSHLRVYSEKLIESELSIVGFKIVEIKRFYAFKKNYKLKKVLSMILHKRWKPNNLVIKAINS